MLKRLFNRRRVGVRRNVDIPTTVREADGDELQVRIVSLSARGFRLKGSESLREGAQLSINLPGYGGVSGRVVWADGDECGGILQNPIPIDQLPLTETAA